jgi:hypothetical protein
VPDPRTTAILDTDLEAAEADAAIARICAELRAAGRSAIWWVTPNSRPRDLRARLEAAGWELWGRWPAMAIELRDLPPQEPVTGLEVRPVRTPRERAAQHAVLAGVGMAGTYDRAFGWRGTRFGWGDEEPFQHVVGWLGDRPVGCATMIEAGGAAGLYAVAVAEEVRRRGIGRAVSLAALHAGAKRGHRFGVLQTSDLGYPVYRGIGFRLVWPAPG